jgi:hypothetical protein
LWFLVITHLVYLRHNGMSNIQKDLSYDFLLLLTLCIFVTMGCPAYKKILVMIFGYYSPCVSSSQWDVQHTKKDFIVWEVTWCSHVTFIKCHESTAFHSMCRSAVGLNLRKWLQNGWQTVTVQLLFDTHLLNVSDSCTEKYWYLSLGMYVYFVCVV